MQNLRYVIPNETFSKLSTEIKSMIIRYFNVMEYDFIVYDENGETKQTIAERELKELLKEKGETEIYNLLFLSN